ncbi:response regulator [Pelagibius sp.]|uniref:response regulator n=1 Tax=Pelagibius sp. TaxID=1931238 RepID=UPI00261CF392|nr:response regulator [Pelagibius sp.]
MPKSILIADDQDFVRSLMTRMLQQLGFNARAVHDGREAAMALKFIDGALILDQQMGGLTGLELLKSVRTGETILERGFPVLILTGHADMDVVKLASELDVTALLTKPVSKAQLKDRMSYALTRKIDLKPAPTYAAIEVPKAKVEDLPVTDAPMPAMKRRPKTEDKQTDGRKSWVLKGNCEADPALAMGDGRRVHYSKIQPGMMLVENLYGKNGALLLGAGTELTEDMIGRLITKCESNSTAEYLTVVQANRPSSSESS